MAIQEPQYQSALDFLHALSDNFDKALSKSQEKVSNVFLRSIVTPEAAFLGSSNIAEKMINWALCMLERSKGTIVVEGESISKGNLQESLQTIYKLFLKVLSQADSSSSEKLQAIINFVFQFDQLVRPPSTEGFESVLLTYLRKTPEGVQPPVDSGESVYERIVSCSSSLANAGNVDLQRLVQLFSAIRGKLDKTQAEQMEEAIVRAFTQDMKEASTLGGFVAVVHRGVQALQPLKLVSQAAPAILERLEGFELSKEDIPSLRQLYEELCPFLSNDQKREMASMIAKLVCDDAGSCALPEDVFDRWKELMESMPSGDKEIPFVPTDFLPIVNQLEKQWRSGSKGQDIKAYFQQQQALIQRLKDFCPKALTEHLRGNLELALRCATASERSWGVLQPLLGSVQEANTLERLVTTVHEHIDSIQQQRLAQEEVAHVVPAILAQLRQFTSMEIAPLCKLYKGLSPFLSDDQKREISLMIVKLVCDGVSSCTTPEKVFERWQELMQPTKGTEISFLPTDFTPIVHQVVGYWGRESQTGDIQEYIQRQRTVIQRLQGFCPPDVVGRLRGYLELALLLAPVAAQASSTLQALSGGASAEAQSPFTLLLHAIEQPDDIPEEVTAIRAEAEKVLAAVREFVRVLQEPLPPPPASGESMVGEVVVASRALLTALNELLAATKEARSAAEAVPQVTEPGVQGTMASRTVSELPRAATPPPERKHQAKVASRVDTISLCSLTASAVQFAVPAVLGYVSGGSLADVALSLATPYVAQAASALIAPVGRYLDEQCERLPEGVQSFARWTWRAAATVATVGMAQTAFTYFAGRSFSQAPAHMPTRPPLLPPSSAAAATTAVSSVAVPAEEVAVEAAETAATFVREVAPATMEAIAGAATAAEAVAPAIAEAIAETAAVAESAVPAVVEVVTEAAAGGGMWGVAAQANRIFEIVRGAVGTMVRP